ncbi:MAG: cupin domain-containing protein [Acidobacteriota bacterium]
MTSSAPIVSPRRHPGDDALVGVASGDLPRLRRLLVEAHVAQCDTCSARLAAASWPGGRWLEAAEPATPAADSWLRLTEHLDAAAPPRTRPAARPDEGLVPAVVWNELDDVARSLRWRPLLDSSTRIAPLAADRADALDLFLVRTPAGGVLPHHRHLGAESVLVLVGSYHDCWGEYHPGDYHLSAAGTSHEPRIGDEAECWALVCVGQGLDFDATSR